MASSYGQNFGFTRSDESVRWSEGGYRVPAVGTFKLGTVVQVDPAAPGYLKQAGSNVAPAPGYVGLLVQELEWDRSIYESSVDTLDSWQMGTAKNSKLAVITAGSGTKFWVRNTLSQTRADGRVIAAVTMVTISGLAAGDVIGWDGSKFVEVSGGVTNALARVLSVNATTLRVDAVLI